MESMDDIYGDGAVDCKYCKKCGLCITCGDCVCKKQKFK